MSPRKRTLTAKAAAAAKKKKVAEEAVVVATTATGLATKTKTPRMNTLVTIVPPAQVTDHYKQEATTAWTYWDSRNMKSFTYNYTAEEQILMVKGRAKLIPKDGSPPLTIAAGDQVTLQQGLVYVRGKSNNGSKSIIPWWMRRRHHRRSRVIPVGPTVGRNRILWPTRNRICVPCVT